MSDKYLGKYRNGTNRLSSYDYKASGSYFITLCVRNTTHPFGKIVKGEMHLSELGKIVRKEWLRTFEIRKSMNLELSDFCVMPDHFHALIIIHSNDHNNETCLNKFGIQSQSLGSVVRGFKAAVTTHARKNNILFDWQPRYHDRIVRDVNEFDRIRKYITSNVTDWIQPDE